MDFLIPFIFFVGFAGIFVIMSLIKQHQKKVKINNAQAIFSRNESSTAKVVSDGAGILNNLSSILSKEASTSEIVVMEATAGKDTAFFQINDNDEEIKILVNPKDQNQSPDIFKYSDVLKIRNEHQTYSVSSGSGKSSKTYYYNKYYTTILFIGSSKIRELTVYSQSVRVEYDKGFLEMEARAIGEKLAKIFKTPLLRINGEEVPYDHLDDSITEKLDSFVKPMYKFNKQVFVTEECSDYFSINELKYYNSGKITLGVVLICIALIVELILIYALGPDLDIAILSNRLYRNIFALSSIGGSILFIIFWVMSSKYNPPLSVPLVNIYKDSILSNLKYNKGNLVTSEKADLSQIEEIQSRYEKSKGYVVKLIGDNLVVNVGAFTDPNKANWLRDEILDLLKRIKEK